MTQSLPPIPSAIPAACPVCTAVVPRRHMDFLGHPIWICRICGTQFMYPQPTDSELAGIYHENYSLGQATPEEAARTAALKQGTAKIYLDAVEAAGLKPPGTLLELGCGSGDFLYEGRARGWSVQGIEFAPAAVAKANARLGAELVRQGQLSDLAGEAGIADLIASSDVIEHVRDPLEFARDMYRLLRPGGAAFVATISLDSWSAKVLGRRWMEYKLEHLTYFTDRSLKITLEQAGLKLAALAPNPKVMSVDYVAQHFERYPVPGVSPIAAAGAGAVRALGLDKKEFKIVGSGVYAIAVRPR
jgi:2-polyprenyl-3-methyl-5-hydroxy-6-metoxy-1,4-benzoquinol methylase